MNDYDSLKVTTYSTLGQKRPHFTIDDDEDDINSDDDYENLRQSLPHRSTFNEYDHYVQLPRIEKRIRTLDFWRHSSGPFMKLSRMARDYFAVPATGAGVERQFSGSGRVVTPARSRLSATTISDIMMYKNHLTRLRKDIEYWKGAGMGMREEIVALAPVALDTEIPKEWRDNWWAGRFERFIRK